MAAPRWRLLAIQLHLRYLTVPGAADQMEAIVEDVTERRSLEHQLLPAQKFETIGNSQEAWLTISAMWWAQFWDGPSSVTERAGHFRSSPSVSPVFEPQPIATATKLRARFPGLPVLFTSGCSEATGVTASQLENSYYVQKPYRPTSLGRAVRKILDPPPSPAVKPETQPQAPDEQGFRLTRPQRGVRKRGTQVPTVRL